MFLSREVMCSCIKNIICYKFSYIKNIYYEFVMNLIPLNKKVGDYKSNFIQIYHLK